MPPDLKQRSWRLNRTSIVWTDESLSVCGLLHVSGCAHPQRRCSCRTALDRIIEGTVVTISMTTDTAVLVNVPGYASAWLERGSLEPAKDVDVDLPQDVPPEDYLAFIEAISSGWKPPLSRATLTGGDLVVIRDSDKREPWRYIGRVHHQGLCALVVSASLPKHRVLDADVDQVRVVNLGGRKVESVLMRVCPPGTR